MGNRSMFVGDPHEGMPSVAAGGIEGSLCAARGV